MKALSCFVFAVIMMFPLKCKLTKTKAAFEEVFNNQKRDKTSKLIPLIETADEEQKVWIRQQLIERLNSDPDSVNHMACLVGIGMFPDEAPEVFAKILTSHSDRKVRGSAAYGLGQRGTEKQVDALLKAIKDDKGVFGEGRSIAGNAISSLGEIGGKQAILALREIWNNEELSRGCREQTLTALGMAGDPDSLRLYEEILQGKDQMLRDNAALGLGRLARKSKENPQVAEKAVKLLRSYINDDNPKVRRNVVHAFGWVAKHDDIDLLIPLLNDPYSTTVNYNEDGHLKEKVVYPIREKTKEAIDRINARLASRGEN